MSKAPLTRGRRVRVLAAAATAGILAVGLAACSSDSGSGSTTSAAAGGGSAAASAGGSAAAGSSDLDALEQPLAAYPVPTESIGDVSSLKGKTVYYIPITQQSPQFAVTQQALTEALDTVGVSVQVCDGKGTPTDVSACITQATEAKAGTIVTDAVSYKIATNAIDAAQAANIPVIISNQIADDSHPASKTLAYIPGGGSAMQEALAQWVIADSGGSANVLINQSTDGPSPAAFVAAGKQVYEQECPGCTVTINEISSANFSLIPSSTSSALLQNPDINYVESQFEQYLQPTQSGVEQAGKTDAVKGLTGSAQLAGLQALAGQASCTRPPRRPPRSRAGSTRTPRCG